MAKKIIIGVTGSIAAYKACELVRRFVCAGCDVHVVMTDHAKEFVTPLTFRTLSRNQVEGDMFAAPQDWKPEHIALAESADALIIAPATANILAKLAHGIADDMLSSVALAVRAPIWVAPAMNEGMWLNAATQTNLAILRERGVRVIEPESGELACGVTAKGRMAEPEIIFRELGIRNEE